MESFSIDRVKTCGFGRRRTLFVLLRFQGAMNGKRTAFSRKPATLYTKDLESARSDGGTRLVGNGIRMGVSFAFCCCVCFWVRCFDMGRSCCICILSYITAYLMIGVLIACADGWKRLGGLDKETTGLR